MPRSNAHLNSANAEKNAEYYTLLENIEKEMEHHVEFFKGKTAYCNCDDPSHSQFAAYFDREFGNLGLNGLIVTGMSVDGGEPVGAIREGGSMRRMKVESGDFMRNSELLRQSDVVVTNPPFHLFRDHLHQAMAAGNDIMTVGSLTVASRPDVFPLIRKREFALGAGMTKFGTPDGNRTVNARWFGTLPNVARMEPLDILRSWDPLIHRHYDNYDAIDVQRVHDIPADVDGEMGVPLSFLMHWDPDQFDIIGILKGVTVKGGEVFTRILIRHRDSEGATERLKMRREEAFREAMEIRSRMRENTRDLFNM